MDSNATSDETQPSNGGQPGAIPGGAAQSAPGAGAVRSAGRPNRRFLRHRAPPAPKSAESIERSLDQVPPPETPGPGGPGAVPARDEQQVAPSLSPLDDDFDLDAALAELTSRKADGGSRFDAWRRRSATGALLTGIALGLNQVFEPERKEPTIVLETSGQPPRELPIEADLDQLLPRETVIKVRPWLLASVPASIPAPEKRVAGTSSRLALLAPVGVAQPSARP